MLWILLFVAIYPYVVYPALVRLIAESRSRLPHKADVEPSVTVVIAAYNEASVIGDTIRNKLQQNYPPERLQVVVVSDSSDDGTDQIVDDIAASDSRVRLLRQEPRQGKTAALNRAIAAATTEIIIFSDANSRYASDGIRKLVRYFADERVGYVTGRMVYTDSTGRSADDGSGAYMQYENQLRLSEMRLGSIVGVDGGIDAVRRELYLPMRPDQLPDFVLPLGIVERGYRVVYEPDAILYEASLASAASEFRMRVRVALRALWALWDKRKLLNPFQFPLFSWQLASHKLLRYLSPIPLLFAFLLALAGAGDKGSHLFVLGLFATGCAGAMLGSLEPFRRFRVLRLLHFFAVLNMSNLVACFRFLKRDKIVVWRPRLG
jgi:cellulose synthase/poly-beta-1,6-N-acetylglucosamine synthase-like glycosyltransferase